MDTIDKILKLMEDRNVTAAKLTRESGLTNGLITQWKQRKQNPSNDSIAKIAAYFNVSTDFLLGNTDDPTPTGKKKSPPELINSEEDLRRALVKEGILPAGGAPLSDEDKNAILAFAETYFKRGHK